jgi:hypothetical protein
MKLDKLTFASDLSGGFIGTQNLNCECADGWQMADGRWQMADGRWQMADGRWQILTRSKLKSHDVNTNGCLL